MTSNNQEQLYEFETVVKICERAEAMGIEAKDRITLIMDIDNANEQFCLRLQDLLSADNFNFTHDVWGIQRHMNRRTGLIDDMFVPRFAR